MDESDNRRWFTGIGDLQASNYTIVLTIKRANTSLDSLFEQKKKGGSFLILIDLYLELYLLPPLNLLILRYVRLCCTGQ